jgi:hypothetical protein
MSEMQSHHDVVVYIVVKDATVVCVCVVGGGVRGWGCRGRDEEVVTKEDNSTACC